MKTSAKNFFTKEEKERIIEAIKLAEKDTSGEIRQRQKWCALLFCYQR